MQSLKVGESYLVRTNHYAYTGRLRSVSFTDVVLGEAACLPHLGNYHDALRTGELSHVEPYPDEVILSATMILEASRWRHPLPRELKRPMLSEDDEIPF